MSKNAKILAVVAIVGVIGYLIYSNKPAAAPAAAAAPTPSATGVVAQAQAALVAIQTGYAQGKATVDSVQAQFGGGAISPSTGSSPTGSACCCNLS